MKKLNTSSEFSKNGFYFIEIEMKVKRQPFWVTSKKISYIYKKLNIYQTHKSFEWQPEMYFIRSLQKHEKKRKYTETDMAIIMNKLDCN